jgi:hypothetical protein
VLLGSLAEFLARVLLAGSLVLPVVDLLLVWLICFLTNKILRITERLF